MQGPAYTYDPCSIMGIIHDIYSLFLNKIEKEPPIMKPSTVYQLIIFSSFLFQKPIEVFLEMQPELPEERRQPS